MLQMPKYVYLFLRTMMNSKREFTCCSAHVTLNHDVRDGFCQTQQCRPPGSVTVSWSLSDTAATMRKLNQKLVIRMSKLSRW